MENGVILVTVNYRLATLGFMSLGSPEYSGNMGMKDQRLALKWIHENIGAFGGDNKQITIGGLSAGSKALGLHLFNKESSKYFNQLLGLSGTSNTMHSYQKGDHKCLMNIFFKSHHSRYPHNNEELIDFLQNVNVDKIIKFTENTIPSYGIQLSSPWNPIVESKFNLQTYDCPCFSKKIFFLNLNSQIQMQRIHSFSTIQKVYYKRRQLSIKTHISHLRNT